MHVLEVEEGSHTFCSITINGSEDACNSIIYPMQLMIPYAPCVCVCACVELLRSDLTDDIICDIGMPVIHRSVYPSPPPPPPTPPAP